jgi:hypothetical protein
MLLNLNCRQYNICVTNAARFPLNAEQRPYISVICCCQSTSNSVWHAMFISLSCHHKIMQSQLIRIGFVQYETSHVFDAPLGHQLLMALRKVTCDELSTKHRMGGKHILLYTVFRKRALQFYFKYYENFYIRTRTKYPLPVEFTLNRNYPR